MADLTHLHSRLCGSLFDLASRTLRDLPRPWQSKALIFPASTLDSWHTSFASHKCVCSGHSAAKTRRASAALCSPKASQTMASSSVVVGELRCRLVAARDDPSADLLQTVTPGRERAVLAEVCSLHSLSPNSARPW